MRKIITVFLFVSLLCLSFHPLSAQEVKKKAEMQKGTDVLKKESFSYNPAGRRDPFKNLLVGQEVKDKTLAGGISQISINDIILIGIAKSKGKLTAIINGPQGFPFYLKIGDRLLDGFVLSIKDSKAIFRKTRERGLPLYKSKDIVKEINPEER